jgi:hypothetical protein
MTDAVEQAAETNDLVLPIPAGPIELPQKLKVPIDALNAKLDELARIRESIEKAVSERAKTEAEYGSTFAKLAEAEASVVLENGAVDANLRKVVARHRETLTLHDARIAGLRTREEAARSDVDAAMRAADTAKGEWIKARIAEARAEAERAVDQFKVAIMPSLAIGLGLHDKRLVSLAYTFEIPDDHSHNALISIGRGWRDNGPMLELVIGAASIPQTVTEGIIAARLALIGQ